MTSGTVIKYDSDEETGYIDPDDGDERIPFDSKSFEKFESGWVPQAGDRVKFVVEGGMAGLWAIEIRRVQSG